MTSSPLRVLITGATGFVGGAVARRWAEQGLRAPGDVALAALVRDPGSPPAQGLARRGIELRPGDLERPETLGPAVEGCSLVFHAANDMRVRTRATTWKVGVEGTRQLHRAAAQAGAQAFLFVSSFAVYGGGVAAEESAELRPWGEVYGDGKIQAEGALRERASGGPRVVVLRLPAVYGPGSAGWTVRPLAEARRRTLRVPGAGGFAFPYLYVENMVDAATAAALSDREGTYNIHDGWTSYAGFMGFYARMTGSEVRPTSWSVLAVAAAAAELWGRLTGRPPRITRAVLRTVRSLPGPGPNLPAADRAARELGWRPRVSLEAGMAAIRESAQLQDPAASVQGGKLEANDSSRRGG